MARIRVEAVEWYPVWEIQESGEYEIEVTPQQLARWRKALKEFTDVLNEIGEAVERGEKENEGGR